MPDEEGYVTAERTQSFSSSQARWMFLALANCDPECGLPGMCQGSLDVYYELEFTNGEEWSVRHYSADEIGVAETEIFFFVLQIALMIFGLVVREPSTDAHLATHSFFNNLGDTNDRWGCQSKSPSGRKVPLIPPQRNCVVGQRRFNRPTAISPLLS